MYYMYVSGQLGEKAIIIQRKLIYDGHKKKKKKFFPIYIVKKQVSKQIMYFK